MALIQPKSIGREFVRRYYTILNKSPENLYCFYSDDAIFDHDDIDVMNERTVSVVGKAAIRDAMNTRRLSYRHDCTIVNTIDTATTINNGLVIQVFGEIGYNDERMRPFSQSFVLAAVSPIKYYVHNEIFRFLDLVTKPKCTTSECTQANESTMTAGEDTESADSDDSSIPNEPISSTLLKSDENIHTTEQSNGQQPQINGDQNTLVSDVNTSSAVEQSVPTILSAQTCEISPIKNQLFQDKCILTIGNVVNPNIDADDQNRSYELLQKKQQGIQTDENNNTSLEEFTQAILKANSENTVTKTYADSLKSNRLTSQNTLPSSPVLPTPSVSSDGSPKETKKPADSTKQRPIGARRGSQKSGKKSLSKGNRRQNSIRLISEISHFSSRLLVSIEKTFGAASQQLTSFVPFTISLIVLNFTSQSRLINEMICCKCSLGTYRTAPLNVN